MKGIILYSSKYGATKRYADWLAEATGFDCLETKKATLEAVQPYDTVILGGGIYAMGIAGLSFLRKHIDHLKEKKVIVFCDGASPYEEKAFQEIVVRNLTGPLSGLPCFYCRGSFDLEQMHFTDRVLCSMLQKSVGKKKPEERALWEQALAEVGSQKHDWTDKAYLTPILEAIR